MSLSIFTTGKVDLTVDGTDQNEKAWNVDHSQQGLPLLGDTISFLVLSSEIRAEFSGGEMEADGWNSEKSKACNLSAYTDKTESLAKIKLLLCIRLCWICAGDENGGDELENERNYIEADEEESDEASYRWGKYWFAFNERMNWRGTQRKRRVLDSEGTTQYTILPKTT